MAKKYKKILIFPHEDVRFIREYLDFNNIDYELIDCWDKEDLSFTIPTNIQNYSNVCLVISQIYLIDICKSEKSWTSIVNFLQKNVIISSKDTGDAFEPFQEEHHHCHCADFILSLKKLDKKIPKGSLKIILDCVADTSFPLNYCNNIEYHNNPTLSRSESSMPKIINANTDKSMCEYHFLITAVLKKTRKHRYILKDTLYKNPALKFKGLCVFRDGAKKEDHPWVGETACVKYSHSWVDGHPSMDLYSNAWVEVVPETCWKDFYYITEKTMKPIVTKTPFLVVSTQGYLNFLREMGFKTFAPYIDESYDLEPELEKRIEMVIESLEKIVHEGADKVYHKVSPILEHNYRKYAEYCGKWEHDTDLFAKYFFEF